MTIDIQQAWSAFECEDLQALLEMDIEARAKKRAFDAQIKKRNYYKKREQELPRQLIA